MEALNSCPMKEANFIICSWESESSFNWLVIMSAISFGVLVFLENIFYLVVLYSDNNQ